MLTVVHDAESSNDDAGAGRSLLDEIVRDGARRMLKAEVAAYVEQFIDQVDDDGRRLVVRNGYHQQRDVLTAAVQGTSSQQSLSQRATARTKNEGKLDQAKSSLKDTGEKGKDAFKELADYQRPTSSARHRIHLWLACPATRPFDQGAEVRRRDGTPSVHACSRASPSSWATLL